jgi:transcriptional regulator with XRE-family HTH domain
MKHHTLDGRKVVELREAKGWTQARFARLIGIGRGTMSQLENGVKQPSAETAHKMATMLGVSFSVITAAKEAPAETAKAS